MANVNAPYGLAPLRYADGRPYNGAVNYYFATGASGAIYIGDPVTQAGAANTSEIQGYAPGTLPTIAPTTAGDGYPITGVCVGVLPTDRDSTVYRADSTDRIILVADGPDLIFKGQCDAASTAWAGTDVSSFANLLTGSGSTVTGRSAFTLDTTDGPDPNDVSNQLYIVRLHPVANNAIGAYAQWEVMINNHQLANVADGGRFSVV